MSHVFVIRADITALACDAWMLPTSRRLGLSRWTDEVEDLRGRAEQTNTTELRAGRRLAEVLAGGDEDDPRIVLTAVSERGFVDAPALTPAVAAFFEVASRSLPPRRTRRRARPLLAMPFFGTRGGGGAKRRGEILDELLSAMSAGAGRHGVDAALVLQDPDAYALAQLKRTQDRRFFAALSETDRDRVDSLIPDARSGRLVPFMGAGVSASAGAPTWGQLIERLARRVLRDPRAAESLLHPRRDTLDQAAALRAAWDERPEAADLTFNEVVAEQLGDLSRYGLAPVLLAALPAREAITLNYDPIFEHAAEDAGSPRRVIPRPDRDRGKPADRSNERWLLKLHGSVDSPASIVLTRDDYLGYEQDRGALSSLVKAMLMTRHLLFVGFGLADDHFHEILYDVRRAVAGQGAGALDVTVLKLTADPLDELLWKDELRLIPVGLESEPEAELTRRLEIFLDALICFSSNDHSYLLKDGFGRALSDSERRLRRSLETLRDTADEEMRNSPAWVVVEEALARLGSEG